jgi:putative membrane protein
MIDWGSWRNEPVLVGGLVLLGWLYALAVGPLRPRLAPGEPFDGPRALTFAAGLAVSYVALGSPLDWVGRYLLLTAHTLQHMLLLFPAPGLLLYGVPPWLADRTMGRLPRPLGRTLLQPLLCGGAFILVVSGWYLPRPFERGLGSDVVHQIQNGMFLGVGLWFWWPLLSPSRVFPPLRYGGRMVYLFAIEVGLTGVFTYILMADHAMYSTYEHAPRLILGLSASEDQLLAGVFLSAVSSLVLVGALGVNFRRWAHADSHRG